MVDTPEEKKYIAERDKLRKEQPRKWDYIQKERDKIREKKASQALADEAAMRDHRPRTRHVKNIIKRS